MNAPAENTHTFIEAKCVFCPRTSGKLYLLESEIDPLPHHFAMKEIDEYVGIQYFSKALFTFVPNGLGIVRYQIQLDKRNGRFPIVPRFGLGHDLIFWVCSLCNDACNHDPQTIYNELVEKRFVFRRADYLDQAPSLSEEHLVL